MDVAPRPRAEGEDLGAALGHLVVAALLDVAAPPVAAGEALPVPLLQGVGAIGIHGRPLLAIGAPAEPALLLRPIQIGALHGDELVEIHPVHTAGHHVRDVLAPQGIILPRQAEDEIRHYDGCVIPGQLPQSDEQCLPVVETGRLLAHCCVEALHPEREAVEAPRKGRLPLHIIKTVEPPLQGQLRIRGQGEGANGPGQSPQIRRRHVGRGAAPHVDGREGAALAKGRLGGPLQVVAQGRHVVAHARRVGAVFEEVAEAAALAAEGDMDIERPLLGLAWPLPPGSPTGVVQRQGGCAAPAGMGRDLGSKGELQGIRGGEPRHGRGE